MEENMSIKIIENFLPDELYNECNDYSIHLLKNDKNTFRTNHMWDYSVKLDSATVLVHNINNAELMNKLSNIVKEKFDREINEIMFYYWMPCSHIPWHNDDGHLGGITIYLNEKWDNNHGGIFLFNDGTHIHGIYPHQNRAIEQYGNVYHSVCPTTMNSDIRRTIQMFF
jgi:2OG-Fe(II) oxygenase superfamily